MSVHNWYAYFNFIPFALKKVFFSRSVYQGINSISCSTLRNISVPSSGN